MRVPWTARRSNQSILKETNPEYPLERLMLQLKLQHFGHRMPRRDSLEKTLILGKIEGRRGRGRQRMRLLDGITDSTDMILSKLQEMVKDRKPGVLQFMGSQRVGHERATEQKQQSPYPTHWQWKGIQAALPSGFRLSPGFEIPFCGTYSRLSANETKGG